MNEKENKNRRDLYLKIRVSREELDAIDRKFRNSGMKSRSEFVRAMIFEGYIVQFNEEKLSELLRLARNISGNINQIAVRANSGGRVYGKYASSTAMDGFENTDASILVLHSADDNVIGIEYGYDKYYEKYKDNPRFTFIRFEDRGHNEVYNDPDNTYKDEFNAEFDKWLETLDYDYKAEENKERFTADRAKYITENLDHTKWSTRLDEDLFAQFLDFYNTAIK